MTLPGFLRGKIELNILPPVEPLPETLGDYGEDLYRRTCQARSGARLDGAINNVRIGRAVRRIINAKNFENAHLLGRISPLGGLRTVPLTLASRSWHTEPGIDHNRRILMGRARKLIDIAETSPERPKLLTLTIADAEASWSGGKEIREFLNELKTWARRHHYRVSYLWTVEVQERLAIHYHVVLVGCPFLEKDQLRSWWPHGFSDIRAVATGDALSYALKYVRKTTGRRRPHDDEKDALLSASGLRRFGCSRDVSMRPEVTPAWVEDLAQEAGVDGDSVDWIVFELAGVAAARLPGQEWQIYDWEQIRWHLLNRHPDLETLFPTTGSPTLQSP